MIWGRFGEDFLDMQAHFFFFVGRLEFTKFEVVPSLFEVVRGDAKLFGRLPPTCFHSCPLQSGKHTWPEWPEIAASKRFQANGSRKQ